MLHLFVVRVSSDWNWLNHMSSITGEPIQSKPSWAARIKIGTFEPQGNTRTSTSGLWNQITWFCNNRCGDFVRRQETHLRETSLLGTPTGGLVAGAWLQHVLALQGQVQSDPSSSGRIQLWVRRSRQSRKHSKCMGVDASMSHRLVADNTKQAPPP